ncbi:MAG: hypothetical protein LBD04_12825 [Synergistaceae bacterium]|jgi:hypothetical protein|nr:hypothetical protein [Synergistaceae bacterium]
MNKLGVDDNEKNACLKCGREQGFLGFSTASLCYFCRAEEERERYQKMTDGEVDAAIANIIGDIKKISDGEETYEDFIGLLSLKNINTAAIAKAAFENNVFFPSPIYRDAGADVRDGLVSLLEAPNCEEANDVLECLAEIGDEVAAEAFRRFDEQKPQWRQKLYGSVVRYLQYTDHWMDESGAIIPLYFEPCYEFIAGPKTNKPAAWIGGRLRELCGRCGCELMDLLVIDGDHERLKHLELSGTVSVPICPNCATKTVIRYSPEGKARMEIVRASTDENYFSEDMLSRLTAGRLVLSSEPMPPFFGFCPQEVARIGGRGNWEQTPQFEDCPDCGRKMKLLAQLAWSRLLDDFAEGALFVEICPDCKTIAVIHQQT